MFDNQISDPCKFRRWLRTYPAKVISNCPVTTNTKTKGPEYKQIRSQKFRREVVQKNFGFHWPRSPGGIYSIVYSDSKNIDLVLRYWGGIYIYEQYRYLDHICSSIFYFSYTIYRYSLYEAFIAIAIAKSGVLERDTTWPYQARRRAERRLMVWGKAWREVQILRSSSAETWTQKISEIYDQVDLCIYTNIYEHIWYNLHVHIHIHIYI